MLLRYTPLGRDRRSWRSGPTAPHRPALDPPGRRYRAARLPGFTWTKVTAPALGADQLGRIDSVLLSHDHHFDSLDDTGRTILPSADRVLTTRSGARRLQGNALGLGRWESATVTGPEGDEVRVTAM